MIKRTEVITFIERFYCDDCIEIEMKFTGMAFSTNSRGYEYICPMCCKIRHCDVKYPHEIKKEIQQ